MCSARVISISFYIVGTTDILTNEVQIDKALSLRFSLSDPCCTRKVSSQESCLWDIKIHCFHNLSIIICRLFHSPYQLKVVRAGDLRLSRENGNLATGTERDKFFCSTVNVAT